MNRAGSAARRARRLLGLYPKAWRDRYGEEFAELLIAEISERPRSWRRDLDVVRGGLLARLARLGLCGPKLEPVEQVRTSLVVIGCCASAFLVLGMAMWSQLTIGWQWSRPDSTPTTLATVVVSMAMLAFIALAVLALLPVLWRLVVQLARSGSKTLARPALLLIGGVVTVVGARHFENGWPGTGGHLWPDRGLVPGVPRHLEIHP
jgi:hypothetical protein